MKANIPIKSGFLDCSNCGRKYSSTSLTLHELKCRNNNNARKYSTGIKIRNNIENKELVNDFYIELDTNELNIAWEHFKTQLVPCNKCKRKFLPDRLEKHEPNCKASPITGTNH
jgi:DNA-directed RNA polymerase subunit M/transcription elongation factor TFIIS